MLGSHDTFTFMKARNMFVNLLTIFWRCQKLSVDKQYEAGARVFDVRINRFNQKDGTFIWQTSHGLAKFNKFYNTVDNIIEEFKTRYPGSMIRIILESNADNNETLERFKSETDKAVRENKDMIWMTCQKIPWVMFYCTDKIKQTDDFCCHLFNWNPTLSIWKNLKQLNLSAWSLRFWAKKHNPKITQEMKDDPEHLYFIDYVGIYN